MRSLPVAITALGLAVAAGCTGTTRTVLVVPEARSEGGPSTAATLGVPPGHLPKPGQCRIWIPGVPPGHQPRPKSRSCEGIEADAPAGSWILYRPTADRKIVHARDVEERSSSTSFSYDVRLWLLSQTAGRFRSRPWSRGANPRHSNRDRLRAGLPRLHDPDDLRSGAGGWLSGAVLAHVRQEASPQAARDIPRPREPRRRVAGGWRLGGGARPPLHSDDRVSPHGHAAREFQDHEHRRGSPRLSMHAAHVRVLR